MIKLDKQQIDIIYQRLEHALTEEPCTYEDAKAAVDKLREVYFNRNASNFLKKKTIQEIAGIDS